MDLGTISSRYARALFSTAKEKGEEEHVSGANERAAGGFMQPDGG